MKSRTKYSQQVFLVDAGGWIALCVTVWPLHIGAKAERILGKKRSARHRIAAAEERSRPRRPPPPVIGPQVAVAAAREESRFHFHPPPPPRRPEQSPPLRGPKWHGGRARKLLRSDAAKR